MFFLFCFSDKCHFLSPAAEVISPAGVLFAVWTFANLGPRARSLTEKYEQEFGDEYKKLGKKHIIPFIW